ncbi:uncharacterized protein LOC102699498 [Oryza brachyantha]|uniref:uncharacterized protein LOC102699498 n=1 Tax=Oryza brachyantha TaxID=4533 RepID=UPI001ADAE12C|nr:uncharacterized protein LOC102699498 [Oryza brachyantha]
MCKVITIQSLVWLRRTVRRWRSCAAARPGMERDRAVPAGHVAVTVEGGGPGEEARRFVVRVAHLNHPAFRELLRQAEEEYGFPSGSGPVALPCDEDHFRDVIRRVSSDERHHLVRSHSLQAFCGAAAGRGLTKRRAESSSSSSRAPLLQGMAMDSLVW